MDDNNKQKNLKDNSELKSFYDSVYVKGEEKHFTSLISETPSEEANSVSREIDWNEKSILDVGCGTGYFAHLISKYNCTIKGIDFSDEAINIAKTNYKKTNLSFEKIDVQNEDEKLEKFNIITSLGVLEHMDDPLETLLILKKHLEKNGKMIITSPNWINPRGYMLMPLYFLFDAPITLADLHYFSPIDFENFAKKLNMKLEWKTIDHSWAYGEILINDFKRRIPNVLRDMNIDVKPEKIDNLISWIEKNVIPFDNSLKHHGATGLYIFSQ
tara:strand:- start:360 stop:1172 length:813 start_codon:yes stop_codon:yes gene_type:complete